MVYFIKATSLMCFYVLLVNKKFSQKTSFILICGLSEKEHIYNLFILSFVMSKDNVNKKILNKRPYKL